jgi:putative transposase
LHRSVKRPKLTARDRFFWACLSELWSDWRTALVIVKPETVIAWHRKGFRLFWTWKVRKGNPGRPAVTREVRDLIRRMSRENPIWGAPRIHGELPKLGIDVGETSVSKYNKCEQVHGPPLESAIADVADLSRQPSQESGLGRLL